MKRIITKKTENHNTQGFTKGFKDYLASQNP